MKLTKVNIKTIQVFNVNTVLMSRLQSLTTMLIVVEYPTVILVAMFNIVNYAVKGMSY